MNILYSKPILFFAFVFIIFSCDTQRKNIDTSGNTSIKVQKEVIIYGSENCDHCITFRKAMDEAKFSYEFKDAEASEEVYQELLHKIQLANYKEYVAFPVLEIEGKLYVKPEFSTIKEILSE